MEYKFGIMQGRLTPSNGRGIQFFPFDNWRHEFDIAKEIGLDEIEFIFDYENYGSNPLWFDDARAVSETIDATGISVNSVCFDYFMRRPFYKFLGEEKNKIREENYNILIRILENMNKVGIGLIEIPLVDNSSIKTEDEKQQFISFIKEVINSSPANIRFGFEADFAPEEFRDFLGNFDEKKVGANYDTGNSSGIGYNPVDELVAYGTRIFNIHIKDRQLHGTTMKLGTGSADFQSFFMTLSKMDYRGSFIMQAARESDGRERDTVMNQVSFVKGYISKYL